MMNTALIKTIKKNHPDVSIVMASKYLAPDDFTPFIEAGITKFGESRVEAFLEKLETLNAYNVEKHFLGTLQTKKVKKIINDIDVLHSLDRVKLAREIDKRRDNKLPCFIQVNISDESQKHGITPDTIEAFINTLEPFKKIHIVGLMGMAELTEDKHRIHAQFKRLKRLRDKLQSTYPSIKYLSMGMSNDYIIALQEGASHLRLGRILLDGGQS